MGYDQVVEAANERMKGEHGMSSCIKRGRKPCSWWKEAQAHDGLVVIRPIEWSKKA